MPKTPKIVTRSATTSSNSTDNLNKGSKLTFAEMDSNFIELKNGAIGVVADDSSTLDVKAGDTLYIQGGSNVTTATDSAGVLTINATGGDSLGDLTAIGSTISSPSNAAITLDPSGTGTIELNANTNITGAATVSGAITGSSIKVGSRSSNATDGNTDDPTAGLFIGDPYTGIGDSTQVFVGQNDTPWMQQMGTDGLASNSQAMDANVIHNQVDNGHTYISTTGNGQVVIPRVKLGWPLSGITVNGTGTSPQVTIGSLANEGNMLATINAGTIDVYTRIRTNEEQFPDSTGTYDGHGLQIQQNEIFSWASNDDVKIHANGSGRVHLENLTIADDGAVVTGIKDEDNMSSNSNVKLATQQSIKAYVDAQVSGVATGDLSFIGSTISSPSNADLTLTTSGTGVVAIDNLTVDSNINITDNEIKATVSNSDLMLSSSGTGRVVTRDILEIQNNTLGPLTGADKIVFSGSSPNGEKTIECDPLGVGNLSLHLKPSNSGKVLLGYNREVSIPSDIAGANMTLQVTGTGDTGITFNTSDSAGTYSTTIKSPNPDELTGTSTLRLPGGDTNQTLIATTATQTMTNKTLTSPVLNTGVSGTAIKDEDNMSSNSATHLATQQSIKAYVDSQSGGAANTGDITFVGSTMISPSNADITLNPAGTGKVNINAVYTLPNADGSANQVLGTNGSGVLSFRDPTAINIDGGVADSTYTSVPTIDGGTA